MREDVIGRANVEDTPELDRYYQELGSQESYALWTVANSIEPWQPQPTSLPQLWSYKAMRPLVLKALDLVSPEKAGRRVIALENPGRKGTSACVGWLYSGLQVMKPGESAIRAQPCVVGAALHRSRARAPTRWSTATRWICRPATSSSRRTAPGTITASKPMARRRSGRTASTCCWSTSSTPTSTPCIPTGVQKSNYPLNDTAQVFGGPGLLPAGGEAWSKPYSPLFKYEWGRTYETLDEGGCRDRRLALRRHHDAIRQSRDRRPGDEDARRAHPVAARRRTHQGASSHRLDRLYGRQGQRVFDHRRQALRLE